MTKKPPKKFRILIIEDDIRRINKFKDWMSDRAIINCVTDAGAAIGVLNRDKGRVYAGILLDHDLQEQVKSQISRYKSGSDVVDIIIQNVKKDVPILVHSVNETKAPEMETRLRKTGFSVTRMPMDQLSKRFFMEWFEYIYELYQDLTEED